MWPRTCSCRDKALAVWVDVDREDRLGLAGLLCRTGRIKHSTVRADTSTEAQEEDKEVVGEAHPGHDSPSPA
jgi:hypothetical protein